MSLDNALLILGAGLPNAYPFLAYMTGKTLPKAVCRIVSIWKTLALRR